VPEPRDPRQGPHDPTTSTPARRAASVRRTTAITSIRPEGLQGPLHQHGRGRDVVTMDDGTATVAATSETHLLIEYTQGMLVRELDVTPAVPGADTFVGARAGGGFRKVLDLHTGAERGSLAYLLLDDVPGATLVSGMAMTIAADEGTVDLDSWRDRVNKTEIRLQQADICAGWQTGGTLLANLEDGRPPVLLGPSAPAIVDAADLLGWVDFDPLPAYGTRRVRRLDVWRDDSSGNDDVHVDGFFRDTCADGDAHETVVHEYTVDVTVDPDTMVITACVAQARVLPWVECPQAVGSAERLVGWVVDDLRPEARTKLVGPSTCTHLNDVLRGLEDVHWLADLLPSPSPSP
jgi:Protein of unknown function (DUF2889)